MTDGNLHKPAVKWESAFLRSLKQHLLGPNLIDSASIVDVSLLGSYPETHLVVMFQRDGQLFLWWMALWPDVEGDDGLVAAPPTSAAHESYMAILEGIDGNDFLFEPGRNGSAGVAITRVLPGDEA
jgi:hypothetical protein